MATTGGNLLQRTRCAYFQDVTQALQPARAGHRLPGARGRTPQPRDPRRRASASPRTRPTWRWRSPRWTRQSCVEDADGARELTLDELYATPSLAGAAVTTSTSPHPAVGDELALREGARARLVRLRDRLGRRGARRRGRRRCATSGSRSAPWRTNRGGRGSRRTRCVAGRSPRTPFRAALAAELAAARPLRDNGYKVGLITEHRGARAHRTGGGMTTAERAVGTSTHARRRHRQGDRRRRSTRQRSPLPTRRTARSCSRPIARGRVTGRRARPARRRARPAHARQRAASSARRTTRRRCCCRTTGCTTAGRSSRSWSRARSSRPGRRPSRARVGYATETHDVAAAHRPSRALHAGEGEPELPDRHRGRGRGRGAGVGARCHRRRDLLDAGASTTTRWSRTRRPRGGTATRSPSTTPTRAPRRYVARCPSSSGRSDVRVLPAMSAEGSARRAASGRLRSSRRWRPGRRPAGHRGVHAPADVRDHRLPDADGAAGQARVRRRRCARRRRPPRLLADLARASSSPSRPLSSRGCSTPRRTCARGTGWWPSTSRRRSGCVLRARRPGRSRWSPLWTNSQPLPGSIPSSCAIRNDTDREPEGGLPFSSRSLVECLREGARRFGWDSRDPAPGIRRDGRWLIGSGVASATYPARSAPSTASRHRAAGRDVPRRDHGQRHRHRRPHRPDPGRRGRARDGTGSHRSPHRRQRLRRGDDRRWLDGHRVVDAGRS